MTNAKTPAAPASKDGQAPLQMYYSLNSLKGGLGFRVHVSSHYIGVWRGHFDFEVLNQRSFGTLSNVRLYGLEALGIRV